jgi:fibro-slime domain-containing protein
MIPIINRLGNQKGVVMVVAMVIMLAVGAVGLGMITSSALNSTVAKNQKNKIQSFWAADGQMTVLSQQMIDSCDTNWFQMSASTSTSPTDSLRNIISSFCANDYQGGMDPTKSYDADTVNTRFMTNNNGLTPCWITYDLGSAKILNKVRICWYNGDTRTYPIQILIGNSNPPTTVVWSGSTALMSPAKTYWTQTFSATSGQYVMIKMTAANSSTNYYFGMWDTKLYYATTVTTTGASTADTLFPKHSMTMSASSTASSTAANAGDSNSATYWRSNANDPQWLTADCGSKLNVSKVVVEWSNALSGKTYSVQGSTDNLNWYTLQTKTNSNNTDHRLDTVQGLGGQYRYIRIYGSTRNGTGNGYGVYEISVYAYRVGQNTGLAQFGKYKVLWTAAMAGVNRFLLTTQSYDSLQTWGKVFETPLKQYIELQGGGFYTPFGNNASVPVTYYDFHSNRTNPEFEQPCVNQILTGMVGTFLDSDRKPVRGPNYCLNYCVSKWFRPWTPGDFTIPVYTYTTLQYTTVDSTAANKILRRWKRPGAWNGGEWGNASANEVVGPTYGQNAIVETTYGTGGVTVDTAFKNIVIPDSLNFILINAANGTYQFNVASNFWPLDGKGFGAEWTAGFQMQNDTACKPDPAKTGLAAGVWPHNFAFTMEIKRTFTMVPGLTFQFHGDDDIWLFLDNRLQMDLGGPHAAADATINVDTCHGSDGNLLQALKVYNFDFFYAERHSVQSNCKITTNMLYYRPTTTTQRHWQRDYGTLN